MACRLYLTDDPAQQSLLSAATLSTYITDLELHHRKKNGIRRVFSSAQPLVDGLLQYTSAIDVMIQADPTVSALIYGGAKLVLQVGVHHPLFLFICSDVECSLPMATPNTSSRSHR